ncbi:7SK snRNA methylphosphate capping enzyme-like [Xyrauchen texanus]|uniref:7SK snRNA methylphosphate capping enzyme-like n=1 Tax=Xyrauchen texanus TaxID=154827 RepID=UPI002242067C|nr:7SK snRNA methylphosphate capping enzyme-like [Xyrauchen texanus]
MLTAMSVQSELPGSGGAGLNAHPQSPLQMSCPVTIQDALTANTMLVQPPGNHVTPQDGVGDAAAPQTVEGPVQIKNGLQSRVETPQKLNKRRYSMNVGFKHPSLCKRRRRANSESDPVLPSNFLLGGNIFDPLNLNSLMDEEVNKALNAETPKSSPLPAKNRDPVEILIPKDITDPLNLNGSSEAAASLLMSPVKRRKHRYRHHGAATGGSAGQFDLLDVEKSKEGSVSVPLFPLAVSSVSTCGESVEGAELLAPQAVEESPRPYELNTSINCRDEVVTPILPRRRSHPSSSSSAPHTQSIAVSSASSAQACKHRKRRSTYSHSDRLSFTPTLPTKHPIREKSDSQMFHTPVVGGASGVLPLGAQKIPQHQRRPKDKFQYGNYSHYYGYRTPALNTDPRLDIFRPEWFRGKKVLDVGCSTGHITLTIARYWSPNHILGVDIDGELVHAARQNLRHFLSELSGPQIDRLQSGQTEGESRGEQNEHAAVAGEGSEVRGGGELGLIPLMHLQLERVRGLSRFPLSFTRCRGPIATPPIMPHVPGLFPSNVSFLKGNYVPDSDAAVMSQCAEYDVIMCLSLTKWVHLNFGDAGIRRLFQRIYRHLLPGGVLILEPQPWSSYARRKRLTEVTHRNYTSIRLKPEQFSSFLTTDVGFSSYELIATPHNCPKGFQRPIYLFYKGPSSNRK